MNRDEILAKAQEYIDDNLIECCEELLEYDSETVKHLKFGGYLANLEHIMRDWDSYPGGLTMKMIRSTAMRTLVEEYRQFVVDESA